jgi:hypothetical protein
MRVEGCPPLTALHCTAQHSTAQHSTHHATPHHTTPHHTTPHHTTPHHTTPHHIAPPRPLRFFLLTPTPPPHPLQATTLKRNGSDYSATIMGALFRSGRITIWTDVDGVYSADPRKVGAEWGA